MSLGYADRLKQKRNLGGQLGAKEYHQSFDDIQEGVKSLAKWVADAQRVFVFTGAGISTACGIPDFRGPKGIWTLRKKKAPVPTDFTPFEYAKPTFTHMAISGLVAAGKAPYVCSQNVDSLHLWSGVPRGKLAELHGNCFAERCSRCRTEYARDFQMETVDFKPSGRRCSQPGCDGALVDNILDWDTPLPEDELDQAVQQAEEADVALVLGTSLQIQPANEIPTLTRDEGGKMVIVNLQKTPKDRKANLIVRGRVDVVMALLMRELGMEVPPYIRTERLVVEHELTADSRKGRCLTIRVRSPHGRDCPTPMVESLKLSASADGGGEVADADGAPGSGRGDGSGPSSGPKWGPLSSNVLTPSTSGYTHSFVGLPDWVRAVRCTLLVRLVKWADEDKRDVTLQHSVDLTQLAPPLPGGAAAEAVRNAPARGSETTSPGTQVHSFVSQEVRYDPATVIAAFVANPPPVVMPDQPRKRQKSDADRPAATAPTRVSQRQSRTSQKAHYPSESSASASCNSEEST